MDGRFHIGFAVVFTGIVLIIVGIALMYIDRIPLLGRLPGDINIHRKGWSFHFPVITGLVISVILTIIINLIFRR